MHNILQSILAVFHDNKFMRIILTCSGPQFKHLSNLIIIMIMMIIIIIIIIITVSFIYIAHYNYFLKALNTFFLHSYTF